MIDQLTIERILDAAHVEEVVSEFVTLRKRGVNFVGLCPFHNEKTPSFTVSPAKGLWKCFGCGKGGNAVHFIMEHEQLNYYDALRWLAHKYGIEIKEKELNDEERAAQSLRESLFVINEWARDYFVDTLYNTKEGETVGMPYFRHRGFRDDTIKKFQLGFCPERNDAFAQAALKKGFDKELLGKTGLCILHEDGRLRDRFWGRVMFPVHTLSGKIVAFGGRVMQTDAKTAKYVNSPESEIYHKSNQLYGIYFAKQAIVKKDSCFLVEGYTDVIQMHQSGVENVVASSGTSLTPGQIRLIHRFTNNIVVLYDGDFAGIKASLRGIDMLLAEGMNIKVVLLPDGEDPDSFARNHDATSFQAFIEAHEVDFIRFKTDLLLKDVGDDPIKRAGLIGDIVKSISVIPNDIIRAEYVKKCSERLNVEERLLVSEINKARQKEREQLMNRPTDQAAAAEAGEGEGEQRATSEAARVPQEIVRIFTPEEQILVSKENLLMKYVVRYGEQVICTTEDDEGKEIPVRLIEFIANDFEAEQRALVGPTNRKLMQEGMAHLDEQNFVAERFFLSHPDPEISRLAASLSSDRYQLSRHQAKLQSTMSEGENRLYDEVTHIILDYKLTIVENELKRTMAQMQDPEVSKDEKRFMEVMKRTMELKDLQLRLAKMVGDRVLNV